MKQTKREAEDVTTFHDHDVIVPPHKLKKALVRKPAGAPDPDPVQQAEAALASLSNDFAAWMQSERVRLEHARRDLRKKPASAERQDALFRVAHDIKGHAETFGFPLVAPVADSLCRLIEYTPDPAMMPMHLVDQHVDAVSAIIHEDAGKNDATAQALASRLREITDDYLVTANRDRPDLIEAIVGPPLAPNG